MIASTTMIGSTYYRQTLEQINAEMEEVKAAQNDFRCFEPLYTRYYKQIVGFVYHRIESKEEAFEITAQVFYKALENLPKYKAQGVPFSAWLFRIASNELNRRYKKGQTQRLVALEEEGFSELKADVEETRSDHLDKILFEALEQLNMDEMELIDMRFFEKRSFKEIADICEINESACKLRVYRIIEKLRMKFKNYTS
ncbi:MAG TPA: sigma-70 family RNA polymerase sigma factor [Bacteroidia bacterium]|jgi:RNA polymerase sigma-70 factor (ECF subfamily)